MGDARVYVGKDLEAMSFAVNYHRWILDAFRPYLGRRWVEVGAGTGSFSALLIDECPDVLDIVEPSAMFLRLQENLSQVDSATQVRLHQAIFADVRALLARTERPDSIMYVNVLEHIEDDRGELAMIHETLADGGRCFIFVPALQWLHGPFDRKIGHHRRYAKGELEERCTAAGFSILRSRYFDLAGIVPWWIKYRLLRSESLEGSAVALYDRLVVPLARRIEGVLPVPIGKNILLIAQK